MSEPRLNSRRRRGIAATAIAALLAAAGLQTFKEVDTVHVVAYFDNSTGVYAGDEVRVLGVIVGKIDEITPEDDRVRVELHYDADVKLPADAHAAIVAPSLVSSRYVQLGPQYSGGPQLEDGDELPLTRTVVPVEWDQIKGQLNELAVALGPDGVNKNGALSRLVRTGSAVLDGKGPQLNDTLANLAKAVDVLQSGRTDTFATVKNLQVFVSALASSDQQIVDFNQRLDLVTKVLSDNRGQLRQGMTNLAVAVRKVDAFVRTNRKALTKTVSGLADVTSTVAGQQKALEQVLHVAPNAVSNLYGAYHQDLNAVAVGLQLANLTTPAQLICSAIGGAGSLGSAQAATLCKKYAGPVLGLLSGGPDDNKGLLAYLSAWGVSIP